MILATFAYIYTSLSSESPYLSSSRLQALIPTLAPLLASPLHTHRLHALLTSYKSLTDALLHPSKNIKARYNSYTINSDLLIVMYSREYGHVSNFFSYLLPRIPLNENTGLLTVKLAGSLALIQFINIKPLFNNIYAQSTLQNMSDIHNIYIYVVLILICFFSLSLYTYIQLPPIYTLIDTMHQLYTDPRGDLMSKESQGRLLLDNLDKYKNNKDYTQFFNDIIRIVSDGIALYSLLRLGLNSTYIPTLIDLYLQLPFDLMISRGVENIHSRNLFVDRINGEATMNAIINYLSFKARPISDKTVLRILKQNIKSFLLLTLDIRQYFTSSFSLFSFIMINNNEPLVTSLAATIDAGTKYKNVYLLQEQLNKDNIHDLYDSPEFLRYQYVDIPSSSLLLLPAESLNELLSIVMTTFLSLNSPRDILFILLLFHFVTRSPFIPALYTKTLQVFLDRVGLASKDSNYHKTLLSSNILRIDIQSVIRPIHHHFQYKTDDHDCTYTMTIKAEYEFMEKLKKSPDDETAQLIVSLTEERIRNAIEKAVQMLLTKSLPECYPMCLVYHIFGLYYLKWNRFWQKLTECCVRIASFDNKLYWNCFYEKAYLINGYIDINIYDHIGYSILSKEEKRYGIVYGLERLQDRYKHYIKYSTLTFVLKQRLSMGEELLYGYTDVNTYWTSLFSSLTDVATYIRPYNKQFMGFFIDFLKKKYYGYRIIYDVEARDVMKPIHTEFEELLKQKNITTPTIIHKEEEEGKEENQVNNELEYMYNYTLRPRDADARLKVFLKIFSNWPGIQSIYLADSLKNICILLLNKNDSSLQKLCVEVLCCYSNLPTVLYKESLLGLCDELNYRDTMLGLYIEKDQGVIKVEHRDLIIPIIEHYEELKPLLFMILCSFTKDLFIPSVQSEEDVAILLTHISVKKVPDTRKLGFLNSCYDLIRYMRDRSSSFIHYILAAIGCKLKDSYDNKENLEDLLKEDEQIDTNGNDDDIEDIEDIEDEDDNNNDNNDNDNNNNNMKIENELSTDATTIATTSSTTSKADSNRIRCKFIQRRIRGLCIKRIVECIGYFSSYNYKQWKSLLFDPLTPLIKENTSIIKLPHLISFSPSLYYLYDIQPLLLPTLVECLSLGIDSGKQLGANIVNDIIATINNILGIRRRNG
ncbi:hypothetical protein WA158_003799 [Blastocystis sp. Blastoise]